MNAEPFTPDLEAKIRPWIETKYPKTEIAVVFNRLMATLDAERAKTAELQGDHDSLIEVGVRLERQRNESRAKCAELLALLCECRARMNWVYPPPEDAELVKRVDAILAGEYKGVPTDFDWRTYKERQEGK